MLLIAATVTACGASAHHTPTQSAAPTTTTTSSPSADHTAPPTTLTHPRASLLPHLTNDQLAGQRVIYAYAGLQPPASLLANISAGEVGGVIFFASNISSSSQIRSVIARLQRANGTSPVHAPLLLMTDQEGGQVRRLAGPPMLSEKQAGEQPDPVASARAAGTGAGRNLADAGMNVNLAPVLDVYRQAGNFIDEFQRSYSNDRATVATLGAAFIAAQQRLRVAAAAKHFPGLGAATQSANTDLRPVTLDQPLRTLRAVDEAPYRAAIAAGVSLVMTSWAIYPSLDPLRPAGLSPRWIRGELRQRLGFRGVTITDSIDAGALRPFGSLAIRGVLAAAAGADLILCTATNPMQCRGIADAIAAAITRRQISPADARQSVARILALRARVMSPDP